MQPSEKELPGPPAAAPRRRWPPRVRYSLQTLMLFVLLVSSAYGLWWHWGPWVIVSKFQNGDGDSEVVFSPNGKILVAGNGFKFKFHIYDAHAQGPSYSCGALDNTQRVKFLTFSHDSRYIALLLYAEDFRDFKAVAEVWDLSTRQRIMVLDEKLNTSVGLSFSNSQLVTHDGDELLFWDIPSGKLHRKVGVNGIRNYCGAYVQEAQINDVREKAAKIAKQVLATKNLDEFASLTNDAFAEKQWPAQYIVSARISSDGQTLATHIIETPTMQIWDLSMGKKLHDIALPTSPKPAALPEFPNPEELFDSKFPNTKELFDWSISHDGLYLLLTSGPSNFGYQYDIIDILTGRNLNTFRSKEFCSQGEVLDGRFIINGGTLLDGVLGTTFEDYRAFSMDLSHGVIFPDDGVFIVAFPKLKRLCKIADYFWGAAFSPDNNRLAFLNNSCDSIQLWSPNRPEYWWGVAWLPEFWLTLVFAGAFCWSVWRDRQTL